MSEQAHGVVEQARGLIEQEQHQEAIELLAPWLAENSDDASGWAALGAAHFKLENWAEAESAAREVVRLRPDSAREWSNLGTVLRKLGKAEAAKRAQQRALTVNPSYKRAHTELRKLHELKVASAAAPIEAPQATVAKAHYNRVRRDKRRGGQLVAARRHGVVWAVLGGALVLALLLFAAVLAGYSNARTAARMAAREEAERGAREGQREAQQRQQAWERQQAEYAASQEAARQQAEYQARQEAVARRRVHQMPVTSRRVNPRLTVDYMDSFQSPTRGGARLTDAQRKANWKQRFEGQRVRWAGRVVDVAELWGSYSVKLKCGTNPHKDTDAYFAADSRIALSLRKGQTITVEGTLADHSNFSGYELTEVRVFR